MIRWRTKIRRGCVKRVNYCYRHNKAACSGGVIWHGRIVNHTQSCALNNIFIVVHLASSYVLHFVATALSATTSPLKFTSLGTNIRPVEKVHMGKTQRTKKLLGTQWQTLQQ